MGKITEEKFNEIKRFLATDILVKPSVRYAAEEFGYSSGTVSCINNCKDYREYRMKQERYRSDFAKRRKEENEC